MPKYDWIVAGINNPTFETQDFVNIIGMTPDNTQILSVEEYMNKPFIKNSPYFKDSDGTFNKDKFIAYYNVRANDFYKFYNDDYYKGPMFDVYDTLREANAPTNEIYINVGRGYNPERGKIGIAGPNVYSAPKFSHRELAKANKVYNTKLGKFEDYSVNDHAMFHNFVRWGIDFFSQMNDPLVLATWDEDGEHLDPITGIMVKHKRGEEKINKNGTFYYETLNGRSVFGKDVLSVFDTFTIDGKGLNCIDFFDSNDIKKNAFSVILSNAMAVLPLFLSPEIALTWQILQITKELGHLMPTMHGIFTMFGSSETPEWMRRWDALSNRFSFSQSDYARTHVAAWENIAGIASMIANQWGMQRAIAKGLNIFTKGEKAIADAEKAASNLYEAEMAKNASKWAGHEAALKKVCYDKFMPDAMKVAQGSNKYAREVSMLYMGMLLNDQVYEDMLSRGATKAEAAAVALGSMAGTYFIDRKWHMWEIFLSDASWDTVNQARKALKNEVKNMNTTFSTIRKTSNSSQTKLGRFFSSGYNLTKKTLSGYNNALKYHTTNLTQKLITSGLQNAAEVLSSDFSKSLYEMMGELGFDTGTKDAGAWENALERYSMNFLGGALGGGIFYLSGNVQTGFKVQKKDIARMTNLIRNGHADVLREQVQNLYKEDKLGSKKLKIVPSSNSNNPVDFISTDNAEESQAALIRNLLISQIDVLEGSLNNNRVGLSDEALFENMVFSESRWMRYEGIGGVTSLYSNYDNLLAELACKELDYNQAQKSINGKSDGRQITTDEESRQIREQAKDPDSEYSRNLAEAKKKFDETKEKVNNFFSKDNKIDYMRKIAFALDNVMNNPFLYLDQEQILKDEYGVNSVDKLSKEQQLEFMLKKYPEALKTFIREKLDDAWDKYKQFEQLVNPHLDKLGETSKKYAEWAEKIPELFSKEGVLAKKPKYVSWNDKLKNESDEDYENRDKKKINPDTGVEETDKEFEDRKNSRAKSLIDENYENDKEFAQKVLDILHEVGNKVDPLTANIIKSSLFTNLESLKNDYIRTHFSDQNLLANRIKANLISKIDGDLGNRKSVFLQILKPFFNKLRSDLINCLKNTKVTYEDGTTTNLYDLFEPDPNTPSENLLLDLRQSVKGEDVENNMLEGLNISESDIKKLETILDILYYSTNICDTKFEDYIYNNIDKYFDIYISNLASTFNYGDRFKAYGSMYLNGMTIRDYVDTLSDFCKYMPSNPIFKVVTEVDESIENPIDTLIRSIYGIDKSIDKILSVITNDFSNIKNIDDLFIDENKQETLRELFDILSIINSYVHAASTIVDGKDYIGLNKAINEYADKHGIETFSKLPELDAAYGVMLKQIINRYQNCIKYWLNMVERIAVIRDRQAILIDKALNKSLYDIVSNINRQITIDGESFDLLEGLDRVQSNYFVDDQGNASIVPLYQIEKIFYDNIKKIADKKGLSVVDFIKNNNLLEHLVPGISNIEKQTNVFISKDITENSFDSYSRMMYFLMLLSEDPKVFYQGLINNLNANTNIGPISTQEFAARQAKISASSTFKDLFKLACSKTNIETPTCSNLSIITGQPGSGKSSVVLRSIADSYSDSEILIAAPMLTQAERVNANINKGSILDKESLFKQILDSSEDYESISKELEQISNDEAQRMENGETIETEHFKAKKGRDDIIKITYKGNVKFQKIKSNPKAILFDEATHLSTTEALLLNAWAEENSCHIFLAGDLLQNGHINGYMNNIGTESICAPGSPELALSIRLTNIQKYHNEQVVHTQLRTIQNSYLNDDEDTFNDNFNIYIKALNSTKLSVYHGNEELTGELVLDDDLTNQIIKTLKDKLNSSTKENPVSIAFIGDSNSKYLARLKSEGINPEVLDPLKNQGGEWDYVVVDYNFSAPRNSLETLTFLKSLNTFMTRSKKATVFVNGTLKNSIGENQFDDHTANAPSLQNSVNNLRDFRQQALNKLNLNFNDLSETQQPETQQPETQQPETQQPETQQPETIAVDDITKDPNDEMSADDTSDIEGIKQIKNKDALNDNNVSENGFSIIGYSMFFDMGASETGEEEFTWSYDGKTYSSTANAWDITVQENGVLRNLEALVKENTHVVSYTDKVKLQKMLSNIRSYFLYKHQYSDLPSSIKNLFSESAVNNAKFYIEFRRSTKENSARPIGKSNELGFSHTSEKEGKIKLQAIVVCEIVNKQGRTCRFDLSSLNHPDTINKNKSLIKNTLQERLSNLSPETEQYKRINSTLNNFDSSLDEYTAWFNNLCNRVSENEFLDIDVTNAINFTSRTWFRSRNSKIKLGVDESVNRKNGGPNNPNSGSFRSVNPDLVISDVYTFRKADEASSLGLSARLVGKSVVFVTSDTLLDANKLCEIYCTQKNDPNSNNAVVRMIVLDNYGLSLSELMQFEDAKHANQKATSVPYSHVGAKMFVSMWNARQDLEVLIEKVNKFIQDNNLDNDTFNKLLKIDYQVFKGSQIADVNDTNLSNDAVKDLLDKLKSFNTSECLTIGKFRIGYSESDNGIHVQSFQVEGSESRNMCVISLEKANKYYNLLNGIIDSTTNVFKPLKQLNGKEYIDLNDDIVKNITGADINIILTRSNNSRIAFKKGETWTGVSHFMVQLLKKLTWCQMHPSITKDGISIDCEIDNRKNDIDISKIYESLDSRTINETERHLDKDLFNLVDILMHGTVENIHNKNVQKVSGVFYPNGFFVSPNLVTEVDANGKRGGKKLTITLEDGKEISFYKLLNETPETCLVDVDVIPADTEVDFDKIKNAKVNSRTNSSFTAQTHSETESKENSSYEENDEIQENYGPINTEGNPPMETPTNLNKDIFNSSLVLNTNSMADMFESVGISTQEIVDFMEKISAIVEEGRTKKVDISKKYNDTISKFVEDFFDKLAHVDIEKYGDVLNELIDNCD